MTLPPIVRVFFALEITDAIKDSMMQVIGDIKKRSKSHAIRWAKPENMHITLQFIGEMNSSDKSYLLEQVRARVQGEVTPFNITFGKLCLFPSPYRPRVLVVDVVEQEPLSILSAKIGEGIVRSRYAIDDRPFRGHLTLGRIKQPHGLDLSFVPKVTMPDMLPLEVKSIAMFRSEPHPDGSHYTVMERLTL